MKKKIGYVMAYRKGQNNYGTSLQGYALLKVLQEMGHDVEIINYIKEFSFIEKILWVINAYRCGLGINPLKSILPSCLDNDKYLENLALRTKVVDEYKRRKLLPYFHDYVGFENLKNSSTKYDAVIVGSDQVWIPTGLPTKFSNLLFVDDNVRKIAYASSFGVKEIPNFQKKATGAYLNRFYKIGVREQQGKRIVETLSNQTAKVVADPTLLLTREDWEKEIKDARPHEDLPYIFCYLISENSEARYRAIELSKKKNIRIICIRHLEKYRIIDEKYGDEAPYEVDPNDFIKYIKDAAYIITDSFHCTVFSHIFHKHFLSFYRTRSNKNSRNNRLDSLFAVLGTNPRRLYSIGGLDGIDSYVDWNLVDNNIAELRQNSLDFIKDALS